MAKIVRLEVENIKRVQAVRIEPAEAGLTVIGGRNRQGKTSVLDAILWGLGGNKYKPSNPTREGSSAPPRIQIELNNGVVVTREGKNANLKVIDQHGNKAGQVLLNELIGQLALDLPKFLQANAKEKGEILLQVIGVGDELAKFDREAEQIYNERHTIGQVHKRKEKHAEDLPFEQGVPEEEVSAGELIQQQQAILAKNGENQKLREQRDELAKAIPLRTAEIAAAKIVAEAAVKAAREAASKQEAAGVAMIATQEQYATASRTAESLTDESTAALEASLQQIDETNRRVRTNAQKHQAEAEAAELKEQLDALTEKLDGVRSQRQSLLAGATLPLPGLSIENGELTYQGQKWDCISSSGQLRVAVAIVRQLRPECKFVLLDKTEQMDRETLIEFGKWLESEDLQVIATRVSTGDECSIIIEDGMVVDKTSPQTTPPAAIDTGGF